MLRSHRDQFARSVVAGTSRFLSLARSLDLEDIRAVANEGNEFVPEDHLIGRWLSDVNAKVGALLVTKHDRRYAENAVLLHRLGVIALKNAEYLVALQVGAELLEIQADLGGGFLEDALGAEVALVYVALVVEGSHVGQVLIAPLFAGGV